MCYRRGAVRASDWVERATGTSYADVEAVKAANEALEAELAWSRLGPAVAWNEYREAVARRLATQRKVNALLARKDT